MKNVLKCNDEREMLLPNTHTATVPRTPVESLRCAKLRGVAMSRNALSESNHAGSL
jgi:hypothetical protein